MPVSGRLLCAVFALTSITANGCAFAPKLPERPATASDLQQTVDTLAQRVLDATSLPGFSIALVDRQRTLLLRGYGLADTRTRSASTAHTVFRAGSLAKLFTATAIMRLSENGRLDLDAPVRRYLPSFQPNDGAGEQISVRDLLSHRAGLPCDIGQGRWTDASFTTVARRLGEVGTPYPPDYLTSYSNVGYSIAGHVLEAVTDKHFETWMREQVFTPLAMQHTGFRLDPAMAEQLARGHRQGREAPLPPIRDLPAAGLYTSAADLARYLQWVLGDDPKVLSGASRAAMWQPQNLDLALDFDQRMGIGWALDTGSLHYAGRVVRHGGHTPLYAAELIVLPDQGLGVAVLANSGDARPVVRHLAEATLRLALRLQRNRVPSPGPDKPQRVASRPPANSEGRYATELGVIRVAPAEARLYLESLARALPLAVYADGTFGVPPEAVADDADSRLRAIGRLRFSAEQAEQRQVLVAHADGRRQLFGDRMPASTPAATWQSRIGRYRVTNAEGAMAVDEMAIVERSDQLYLCLRIPTLSTADYELPISAVGENEAVILGLGRNRGEKLRIVEAGDGAELHYSGFRARRTESTQSLP